MNTRFRRTFAAIALAAALCVTTVMYTQRDVVAQENTPPPPPPQAGAVDAPEAQPQALPGQDAPPPPTPDAPMNAPGMQPQPFGDNAGFQRGPGRHHPRREGWGNRPDAQAYAQPFDQVEQSQQHFGPPQRDFPGFGERFGQRPFPSPRTGGQFGPPPVPFAGHGGQFGWPPVPPAEFGGPCPPFWPNASHGSQTGPMGGRMGPQGPCGGRGRAPMGPMPQQGQSMGPISLDPDMLFRHVDANCDGMISREEFHAALSRLCPPPMAPRPDNPQPGPEQGPPAGPPQGNAG
jgi:hypothetical protein